MEGYLITENGKAIDFLDRPILDTNIKPGMIIGEDANISGTVILFSNLEDDAKIEIDRIKKRGGIPNIFKVDMSNKIFNSYDLGIALIHEDAYVATTALNTIKVLSEVK